jgi:hypothetical protein
VADDKLVTGAGVDADLSTKAKKEEADPRQGLPSTVKVESAPTALDLKKPDPDAKGPWIQYEGVGTVRTITPDDWKAAGIECNDYHEWNYLNHKRLPRSAFSDQQLQYLLRVDGRFRLVTDEELAGKAKK